MKEKIILKGSLNEKLIQLDDRETELLIEINRLNNIIQDFQNEKHSSRNSHRSQSGSHRSSSSQTSEKNQLNVKYLI